MKVVLYANSDWYLYNFRRSLLQRLLTANHDVLLVSPPGPYGEQLIALGGRWRPLKMKRQSLNPLSELQVLAELVSLFRDEQPQVVHGFTIKSAVYGGLAGILTGVPCRIMAVAGLGYVFSSPSLKARLLRPFVNTIMRLAFAGAGARLIVQNSADAEFFAQTGVVDPTRIRLIPGSGVDCIRFKPRESERVPGGTFNALLPARLLRDKGIEAYVEAATILLAKGYKMRFRLAGSPDEGHPNSVSRAELETWIARGAIHWMNHVDDMPTLLAETDVVVLPTKYGEGVPRSLVEAGACGLPVIATDIAGCRELITTESNGVLVPVDDVDALVRAIERLYHDRGLAAKLGARGRTRVLEQFSDEIVLNNTLHVYEELLARIHAPNPAGQDREL